jgi:hypothetical protein
VSDFNLLDRFPDMRPVQKAPSLSTVNGIGLAMYGRRDYDEETNTYVGTHFFCLLFIPVLAVGAYRVVDAPGGGWYFIGKVPLSSVARRYNWLIAFLILFGVGVGLWSAHINTPDYKAGQQLAEADRLTGQGEAVAPPESIAR